MSGSPSASVRHVADGALLVEFEGASDEEANAAAVRLAEALAGPGFGPGFGFAGLFDAIPGARTLFCSFDPLVLPHDELARRIAAAPPADTAAAKRPPREHRVPVRYGGAAGPDLAEIASRAGLSPEQAARLHADATYRVAFLGFAPGFAYMTGLPEVLHAPRRATPRPRVRAGSLAIAGPYAGVYPSDGPGGWNLIGEAGARLFDPHRDPPALFAPGDLVRFAEAAPGEIERALESGAEGSRAPLRTAEDVALEVIAPGLWSSVCGAPRAGNASFGAPPGGAMDLESLALGNEAVGNPRSVAALEMAVAGPELLARAACLAVLSGA
ncbi:MAG TPA: 5-oxoprolinase subunit PxpB, partial [Anaeromyxobacter sp.]